MPLGYKKTHEEHVRRVKLAHGNRVQIVGRFVNSTTKLEYECCHGRFWARPDSAERGSGCRQCGAERHTKSHAQHLREVRKVHGDRVQVIGTYTGAQIKIEYSCVKHGSWYAKPMSVVGCEGRSGSGCQLCYYERAGRHRTKKHSVYAAEARALGVTVLGRYTRAIVPTLHRCANGHTWEARPSDVLSGYGCPLCDRSQYRRRKITIGSRTVLVQGLEGEAVRILLDEGVKPDDIAFTCKEGRPTFRYEMGGCTRTYVPDLFIQSTQLVIEVKSAVTFGIFDESLFEQVCLKARSVVLAGYSYRMMVVHRKWLVALSPDWYNVTWLLVKASFSEQLKLNDRRRLTGPFRGKRNL